MRTIYTTWGLPLSVILLFLIGIPTLSAQDTIPRYYRLYLKDKGTPNRILRPNDPSYKTAVSRLTARCLARRAKVLPADSLVSTADLPLYEPYLQALRDSGATIAQTSRWFNTVMVKCDSATILRVRQNAFLDSTVMMRTRKIDDRTPIGKPSFISTTPSEPPTRFSIPCITDQWGYAGVQNNLMATGYAQTRGIAGEDVLVGVLDAGFNWRHHATLVNATVLGEYDFVNHDSLTADEPGENSHEHGTLVASVIGGYWKDNLIGVAPNIQFVFAKTEDVRSEYHIEEDNFVAGLEWMESLGVDITNTSLGYTVFDDPEARHEYSELNGHTAFASRGANVATRLGMVCFVAAGNDFQNGYRYVGVPAEADSAIAVAAVDSSGLIASFSSRGFGGRTPVKPNIAAMGVRNYGANANDSTGFTRSQGTSFASPMACGAGAVVLSARPDLRPYELRDILQRTANHATEPDSAYGYGIVNIEYALKLLSITKPIIGFPRVAFRANTLLIGAWSLNNCKECAMDEQLRRVTVSVRKYPSGAPEFVQAIAPVNGLARWILPSTVGGVQLKDGDSIEMIFTRSSENGTERLRRCVVKLTENNLASPPGTLCSELAYPVTSSGIVYPNPFNATTHITFELTDPAIVSIDVFNALGQKVTTVLSGQHYDRGFHSVEFTPSGLASGAYYYIAHFGDARYVGGMVYLP